jgi:hypothetical protein
MATQGFVAITCDFPNGKMLVFLKIRDLLNICPTTPFEKHNKMFEGKLFHFEEHNQMQMAHLNNIYEFGS